MLALYIVGAVLSGYLSGVITAFYSAVADQKKKEKMVLEEQRRIREFLGEGYSEYAKII